MDAALSFLTTRMRTVREVEDKLDDLQYGEADVLATVERLKELSLLNDEAYAQEFVSPGDQTGEPAEAVSGSEGS